VRHRVPRQRHGGMVRGLSGQTPELSQHMTWRVDHGESTGTDCPLTSPGPRLEPLPSRRAGGCTPFGIDLTQGAERDQGAAGKARERSHDTETFRMSGSAAGP